MITFEPLWETMKHKHVTIYALTHKHGIKNGTVYTMKSNGNVTLKTINKLCNILDCTPEDIFRYSKEDDINDN